MDRRDLVHLFRRRLEQLIAGSGLSHAGFARAAGMDRSTLFQILSPANERLPRAETVAAIAAAQKVSADWLLGLTQTGQAAVDVLPDAEAEDRLARWHAEAPGQKIRHVPPALPDLFKTEAIIRHESGGRDADAGIALAAARLAQQRRPESEMEICSPAAAVESLARGEGAWRQVPAAARREQLRRMLTLAEELYPSLHWHLFDSARLFSAPLTVFGHARAAVHVGQVHLVFNSTEHVGALARHFDRLVRAAQVPPTEIPAYLRRLIQDTGRG